MANEKQLYVKAYNAYRQRSRWGEAESLFRELVDRFPGTPEAVRSRELLAQMGRPMPSDKVDSGLAPRRAIDESSLGEDEASDGRTDLIVGGLTFVGGVAVTVASYINSPNTGGFYIFALGGILFGAFRLFRGSVAFAVSRQFWGFTETEFFKNLDSPPDAEQKAAAVDTPSATPKPKVPSKFGRYVLWIWLVLVAVAVLIFLGKDS